MRIATFRLDSSIAAGVMHGHELTICVEGDRALNAVQELIAGGDAALAGWRKAAESASARRVPLSDVSLLSPVPEPRRDIICVGKNYRAHAAEFHASGFDSSGKEEIPSAPVVFSKATTSVIGPGEAVRASLDPTGTVDYEGELAVVIGTRAFGISKDRAYDIVFGYTVINDITSRDLQKRHNQWLIGKSVDTFGPMGPVLVTADEIGDIGALKLTTHVNGDLRQEASVRDLIFDIPTLIETLTATMTLLPGDIIATGTPAGVGIGFSPPKYLAPGDRVQVEISGIGLLENPVT